MDILGHKDWTDFFVKFNLANSAGSIIKEPIHICIDTMSCC